MPEYTNDSARTVTIMEINPTYQDEQPMMQGELRNEVIFMWF
jgi:hypothetical protein